MSAFTSAVQDELVKLRDEGRPAHEAHRSIVLAASSAAMVSLQTFVTPSTPIDLYAIGQHRSIRRAVIAQDEANPSATPSG